MRSKALIECLSAIEHAKNNEEIAAAINVLDQKAEKEENVMRQEDWPHLASHVARHKFYDGEQPKKVSESST